MGSSFSSLAFRQRKPRFSVVLPSYPGPAVLEVIDPDQFGAVPKSSTVQALISMIHQLAQATDGSGAAVRLVLFDYRKAFDLIDHTLLVQKIYRQAIPRGIARWVSDFLMNRQQRVKFSRYCFSEWGHVPAGVPQGTKLGPCLFLLMINNPKVSDVRSWKYVDDTSVAEVVPSRSCSQAQCAADEVQSWSLDHKFQINADKCKEMVVNLKKNKARYR